MSSTSGRKRTVMVVDDSDDVRELAALQLRLSGYEVIEASDGLEAVELAKERCPALIFMDIQMPETARTPAIAMTAYGREFTEAALAAGAYPAREKPFNFEELIAMVRSLLGRSG